MFAELSITSNFTFLTGASHPEEFVDRAAALGLSAIAIADDNSVAGIVRAHMRACEIARRVAERRAWDATHDPVGPPRPAHVRSPPSFPVRAAPRLIPAARLVLADAPPVTVLPENRAGWANLCRILTTGRLRTGKGRCNLQLADLLERPDGMQLLLWPGDWARFADALHRRLAGRMHLLMRPHYDGRDAERFAGLDRAAAELGIPTLACAAPIMHHGRRRRLADVLSAIRLKRRVDDLGRAALPNAERRLRSGDEMRRLFAGHERAVDRAQALAGRLRFSLDELRHEYPSEVATGGGFARPSVGAPGA